MKLHDSRLTRPYDLALGHQTLAPELTDPVDEIGSQVDEAGTQEETQKCGIQQEPHREGECEDDGDAQDE